DDWTSTDPKDVKRVLAEANQRYGQVVRPIIRLLKAWNAGCGYPYDSYFLERDITGMSFYRDNVQQGLFYAVKHLSTSWSDSEVKKKKVASLKYNISNVEDALND